MIFKTQWILGTMTPSTLYDHDIVILEILQHTSILISNTLTLTLKL